MSDANGAARNSGQNAGMDPEVFAQFLEQLQRYVRERLIPAEAQVIAGDAIPEELLAEMREMGLFGLTMPEEHGGAGYLAEYEAERFFRDARIYRIYEGTTQIMQLVIAKQMLKEFAAGVS